MRIRTKPTKPKIKQLLEYLRTPNQGEVDNILLITVILIIIIGITVLFSASSAYSWERYGNSHTYLMHQVIYGFVGGAVSAFILYKLPFEFLKKYPVLFFLGSLFFMLMVFLPGIGVEQNSARRWVDLGFFQFQPAELVKLYFIIYLAAWVDRHQKNIKERTVLIPFLILLGLLALFLILQPDFSTLVLIGVISGVIYFVAGAPWKYLAGLLILGLVVGWVAIASEDYRRDRAETFFQECIDAPDPLGTGYHICRATTAIGSGRITGQGINQGIQHQGVGSLPEAMNDSIFAVLANETGFLGSCLLIILFVVLLFRSFVIAQRAQSQFTAYVAIGIAIWIFFQAAVNIGAMLNIVPVTGMPLPFVSYGSSSLITVLGAMGLLLHISTQQNKSKRNTI